MVLLNSICLYNTQKAKQSTTMDGSSTEPQTIAKDLLVNPPLPEAICKKCDKVAREPMHPSCCEKKSESITCRPCSEKSKCPHHKKNPEKWILDQALKTKISKWTMRCPNKCSTKFTVNKYGEHQKQCPNGKQNIYTSGIVYTLLQ